MYIKATAKVTNWEVAKSRIACIAFILLDKIAIADTTANLAQAKCTYSRYTYTCTYMYMYMDDP